MPFNKHEQTIIQTSFNRLGLCGCGSTNEVYRLVKQMLERAEQHGSFYESLDGGSAIWAEFGAKVLDNAGLLEHSTSFARAWLTPQGELLLRFFEEFGEEGSWPEWYCEYPEPG